MDENNQESAAPGVPPPPPQAPPNSSVAVHGRKQSTASSIISEVSLDASPTSFTWDKKKVANDIEEASKEEQQEAAARKASKRSKILTLSQVSKACPVEEEAETLILKALEEKKEQQKMKSNILPHVPKNSAKAFETTPLPKTSPAPDTQVTRGNGQNKAPSLHTSVPSPHANVPPPLAGDETSLSSQSHRGKLNRMGGLFRRRQSQMERLQGASTFDSTASNATDKLQGGHNSNEDALVHNANLLFRRNTASTTATDIEQGSPSDDEPPVKRAAEQAGRDVEKEISNFKGFLEPRKSSMWFTTRTLLIYCVLPLVIVASILFYGLGNPELGSNGASLSWLLLFVIRNIVTYMLGKATSIFVIDYLSLSRRFTLKIFGPVIALMIVQSNGYPSISFFFGIWALILLCGSGQFHKHWLFWQDLVDMCNSNNPSGKITEDGFYVSVVGCAILFGAAVSVKRVWLGLAMGKKTYVHYKGKFVKVQSDMNLVREIAMSADGQPVDEGELVGGDLDEAASAQSDTSSSTSSTSDSVNSNYNGGGLTRAQRQTIIDHLEEWEEPCEQKTITTNPNPSIADVINFREACDSMDDRYPFSKAFGLADNREHCFESAQKEYFRLLLRQNDGDVLHFDTIATVALNKDGTMNREKMKNLVRLFRPNRQGELSETDFVKSIDSLYKEFVLLQASINNSGSVSRAFEIIVNYCFFIVLWCIMLSMAGIDPISLFVSLSSIIVAFGFAIGSAASSYFSGLLFILVRRPYDIGDRISVSNVEADTNPDGSTTWFVQDLGLYSTTVRLALTNEVATYCNGSLANSRVINASRSPKAIVHIYLKFSVEVAYDKVRLFRKTIEKFVKQRPREWIALQSFRPTNVVQDQGYVEYKLQLQHREAWQNQNAILNSKAEVTSFGVEVAKQLGMRYVAPPLPVDLQVRDSKDLKKSAFAVSPKLQAKVEQQQTNKK